jgi:hypothetical protein
MRVLWTAFRVLVIVLAVATTMFTVVWVEGPGGRTIVPEGALIDLIALAAIVAATFSLWRERRALA